MGVFKVIVFLVFGLLQREREGGGIGIAISIFFMFLSVLFFLSDPKSISLF